MTAQPWPPRPASPPPSPSPRRLATPARQTFQIAKEQPDSINRPAFAALAPGYSPRPANRTTACCSRTFGNSVGRYGVAQEVLARAIAEREQPARLEPLDDASIETLGLPTNVLNLLERHDILTVRDLDDTRDCQLLQIPKLGGSTVQQIGQAVERARRAT